MDGGAYYDEGTTTWHYLGQCMARVCTVAFNFDRDVSFTAMSALLSVLVPRVGLPRRTKCGTCAIGPALGLTPWLEAGPPTATTQVGDPDSP